MPRTATRSPGLAPLLRSALKVLTPAHNRGRVLGGKVVRDGRQCALRHQDVVGVSAVVGDAGHLAVGAADQVAAAARVAVAAVAAEPPDPNALADFPRDDVVPTVWIRPAISCPGTRG